MEILHDHEAFASWLPVELQRSVINAETLYFFQANATGGPTAAEFNGLLGTSGTLAQDATGLTFADALSHAYTKIRTGSAFSEPDLVITSPATAAAALRTKTTTGAYVFDIVRGPGALNQQNEFDVFGVRTVISHSSSRWDRDCAVHRRWGLCRLDPPRAGTHVQPVRGHHRRRRRPLAHQPVLVAG